MTLFSGKESEENEEINVLSKVNENIQLKKRQNRSSQDYYIRYHVIMNPLNKSV